ncbi:MAG: DUF4380 domain-containing protein [Lentisphaerae bacterium]|nr:DUF4380 domain-containing protein [Lentisphaerota bacterium]
MLIPLLACGTWMGCATAPAPSPPAPASLEPSVMPDRTPLLPVRYAGWKQSYVLTNSVLRVVVVPAIGRIMEIRPAGVDNLLRNDPKLLGKRPSKTSAFTNFGGDWLWPVSQRHWMNNQGTDWPPPELLADGPWEVEAWRNRDGSASCLLMRKYGAPLNVIVTRLITVDEHEARIRILQRALCVGLSKLPVTLWNVSQIGGAERVYLPADPTLEHGLRPLLFAAPPATHLARYGDILSFDAAAGGEYKFGGGPMNAWVAAQRGTVAITERETSRVAGPRPDGGCAIEVYSNSGLGYTEIETLSPEVLLQPGDSLENTLVIECLPVSTELPPADVARRLANALSEP